MSRHTSNVLAGVMLAILLVFSGGAAAQTKAQKAFLERVKAVSTIDDAKFSKDALVIWPSPDVQSGLNYEAMGEQLCLEYKTYGYLVIWFMDSSKYRRDTEMVMLQSYVCVEDA